MSMVEAAQISLPEFNLRYKGWSDDIRERWEVARWQVFHQYQLSPFLKVSQKPRSPIELLQFPGEKKPLDLVKPEDCHVSVDEQAALTAIYEDFLRRQKAA